MIKYEHNMLVLDASLSKADQEAINAFIADVKQKEIDRIKQSVIDSEALAYLGARDLVLSVIDGKY